MSKPFIQEDFFNTLIDFNQIEPIFYSDITYEWSEIEYLIIKTLPSPSLQDTPDLIDSWDDQSESCSISPVSSTRSSSPSSPSISSLQVYPIENSAADHSAVVNRKSIRKSAPTQYNTKKTFECDTCHRYFARRHDLERHTRIHTGVKPYVCPCCQKSFSRSDARNRHFQSDPICSMDEKVNQRTKKKL